MRVTKLIAGAIFAATVHAENDASACGAVSTVIVTVSGTPTTETINLAAASSAVISILSTVEAQTVSTGVAPVDTSTDITATVTKYLTYTEVFNIVEAPTTSATANQGSYYFSEQNGTTIWLGDKTPPTTDALVTGTTTVLVEPIPSGPSTSSGLMTSSGVAESSGVLISNGPTSAEGPADIKSFSTVFLTVLSTKQLTETLTKSTYTVPTSTRTFAGLGTSGWNSSAPTFKAVKVGPTGSGVLTQGFGQKGVSPTIAHASQSGYSYSLSGSAASDIAPKDKAARQVGAIVVATINGVAVSWTNQYDGSWNPISTISTISTPAQVAGPYGSGVVIPETTLPTSAFTSSVPPVYSSELPFTSSPVPPPGSISFGGAIPLGPPSAKHLSTLSTAVGRTSLVSSGFASSVAASLLGPSTVISIGSPTTTVTEGVVAVSSAQAVVVTTAPFSNASSTTNAAAASSSCAGQFGNFTITFDDLPTFAPGSNDTDYPPIFNPYHDLYWSQGFAYAPPPSDPFLPISAPQLAIFIVNATANVHSVSSSGGGGFSAGPNIAESAFWVDAYGAYLGCNDGGPAECIISIDGYLYSTTTTNPDPSFTQTVTLPPCPGLINCTLTPVTFAEDFRSLTGLQIIATVGGTPVTWFMDNLQLGWSNNTCAAGLERDSLPL